MVLLLGQLCDSQHGDDVEMCVSAKLQTLINSSVVVLVHPISQGSVHLLRPPNGKSMLAAVINSQLIKLSGL